MKHFAHIPCLLILTLCCLVHHSELTAQICDKKTPVYFEKNESALSASEEKKLEKLCKVFAQKNDSFMLELHAYSDSVASAAYNYDLASKRLRSTLQYLKKHSASHFKIVEKVRGEAQPAETNATEEGRAKNRRVDIFYWKIEDGRITLKGRGGMELALQPSYFGSCGVCESNPKLAEVYTNEDAARNGIPLTTTDGDALITGGMMSFDFSCDDKPKNNSNSKKPCAEIVIRIPNGNYDDRFDIWRSTPERLRSDIRWYTDPDGVLTYDAKNKCYVLRVRYCPGKEMINLDKRVLQSSGGQTQARDRTDSTGLIAIPVLARFDRGTYVMADQPGRVLGYGRQQKNLWRFHYQQRGPLFFADSGIAENKIGYVFSGYIDRYEAYCDTSRAIKDRTGWCFELPLEAYTKIIYYKKNKTHQLKLPWKYRHYHPKLFVYAADSVVPLTKTKGRKYRFEQPVAGTYVVLYGEQSNPNNKRAYDAQISLDEIRTKYQRRQKVYKAKLKRRQIKKALRSNS